MTNFQLDEVQRALSSIATRGRAIARMNGSGMFPSIRRGTGIEIRAARFEDVERGDIVVYQYAGQLVCRRLLRKSRLLLILKGDACISADPPVHRNQLVGRVAVVIENSERLVHLDTPPHRRKSLWLARLSYPRGVFLHSVRAILTWAERRNDVRLEGDI